MHGSHRLPGAVVLACILLAPTAFAGKAARIELGRRLFMDPTVSRGARFSCASCHSPEHGFSDPRVLSEDENGKTARHSQPLLDLDADAPMHWDGEFFRLRELLIARLASPAEAQAQAVALAARHFAAASDHGGGDESAFNERIQRLRPPSWVASGPVTVTLAAPLARRLEEEGRYDALFTSAFGSPRVTSERLADAMEAYVLSLRSGTSSYDRDDLSPAARRGLELFRGKADCASCHSGERFTDDLFHNTGVAFVPGREKDAGRADRSFVAADHGRFKTPSLRDVARRAPYMHDGTFATLADVVSYYNLGGTGNAGLDKRIKRLGLEPDEVQDLVAFLESLTSDERPGLGAAVDHARDTRIRIEDLDGRPIEGLEVEITPCGDRLGSEGVPGARTAMTGKGGWLSFRFPASTHVTLSADGYAIGEGQPLPDCVRKAELIAAPLGMTVVRMKGKKLPQSLSARTDRNDTIVFDRIRPLGAGEALYVADRPLEASVIVFEKLPRSLVSRRYAIEVGKGFTAMIDLRPDPPSPLPAPPPRPPSAPSQRARERVREAPADVPRDDRVSPPRSPTPSFDG